MITKHLPVKRINWKITSRIHVFRSIYYNRSKHYYEPTILIFFRIPNILTSVLTKILMVKILKNIEDFFILN